MADLIIDDYFKKGLFTEHQIVTANKLNMNYEKSTKLINNFVEALNSTYYKETLDFDISMTKTDSAIAEMFSNTLKSILKRTLSDGTYGEFGFSNNNPYLKTYHSDSDVRKTIKKMSLETDNGDVSIVISGSNLKLDNTSHFQIENSIYNSNVNLIADDIFLSIDSEEYSVKEEFLKKISYQNYYDYEDEEEQSVEDWTSVLNNRCNNVDENISSIGQQELRLDCFNIVDGNATKNTLSLTKNDTLTLKYGYILNYDTPSQEEHMEEINLFEKLDFLTSADSLVRNLKSIYDTEHLTTSFKITNVRFQNINDKTSDIVSSEFSFDIESLGGVREVYKDGSSQTEIRIHNNITNVELYNKYNNGSHHSSLKIQKGDYVKNNLIFNIIFKNNYRNFGLIGYFYALGFSNTSGIFFKDIYPNFSGDKSCYSGISGYSMKIAFQLYCHETDMLNLSTASFFDKVPDGTVIKASGRFGRHLDSQESSALAGLKNEKKIDYDSDELGENIILFIYAIKKVSYNQVEVMFMRRNNLSVWKSEYGNMTSQYYTNSYNSSVTLTYEQLGVLHKEANSFREVE